MDDFDDDFWVTYIAITPEEDADFAGCGRILGLLFLRMLVLVVIGWLNR
jgi:hypothetical protein